MRGLAGTPEGGIILLTVTRAFRRQDQLGDLDAVDADRGMCRQSHAGAALAGMGGVPGRV
jgi:hypothetical protein